MSHCYLIWLEWPEKCFRVTASDIKNLKSIVPDHSRVIWAHSEASFLRSLPLATHALVWNFKADWFQVAKRLKVLATPAAGREFVPETGPKGVKIHFGHFHGAIMAEQVLAFISAWNRGFFRLQLDSVQGETWPRTWLSDKCKRVSGTSAVVYGFGNVGRAIGRKLELNGVNVTGITRHGAFAGASQPKKVSELELKAALKVTDWLVMALPSTTGTDNLLDASFIRKLPRKCVVINVGRGNSVDEHALYDALSSGRLAGAYLDVRKHEPSATVLEADGYEPRLTQLENCISTPHSSAFADDYMLTFFKELKDERLI